MKLKPEDAITEDEYVSTEAELAKIEATKLDEEIQSKIEHDMVAKAPDGDSLKGFETEEEMEASDLVEKEAEADAEKL
jgi:hypothetical protein